MHRTEGDGFNVVSGRNVYDDTDGVRPATQLRHQEMNAIQEEIASVIEAAGISLNAASETIPQMNQLNSAVDAKINAETNLRIAADAVLQSGINAVQSNVDDEESARIAADIVLQNSIDEVKLNLDFYPVSGFTSATFGGSTTTALQNIQIILPANKALSIVRCGFLLTTDLRLRIVVNSVERYLSSSNKDDIQNTSLLFNDGASPLLCEVSIQIKNLSSSAVPSVASGWSLLLGKV